eukprot:scaffold92343_cov42-Prasinocladus_malaysianus.AAC.1
MRLSAIRTREEWRLQLVEKRSVQGVVHNHPGPGRYGLVGVPAPLQERARREGEALLPVKQQ